MFSQLILPLFAALTYLQVAYCNDPNIGFEVSIDSFGIDIFPAGGAQAALVGPSTIDYTFIVPINITRRISTLDALTLRLFAQPYDYDEDDVPAEIQVYSADVFLNEQSSYDTTASFNLTTNATESVVHSLRAQVGIQGNSDGSTTLYQATISGVAVVAYNSTSGFWDSYEPSEFAHQENIVINTEYDLDISTLAEPPIDTTNETVIVNPDPDLPEEQGPLTSVPNPPVEIGTGGNTTTPCLSEYPKPTSSCTVEVEPVDPCKDYKGWKRNNDGKPWKGPDHCEACKDYKKWKRNNEGRTWTGPEVCEKPWKRNTWGKTSTPCTTTTPPPTCTPVPPPCPSESKLPAVFARQSTSRATVRLTLTYGPAAQAAPVRQLSVTAFGLINNERKLASIGKTDNNGFVSL